MKILDIGGGFPAPYDRARQTVLASWPKPSTAEFNRLFPKDLEILAEPGRFLVATAGTLVATVIGKAVRDGKQCYYIDDGVYHTFSGVIFDHIQYSRPGVQGRADANLFGVRPHVRRARHDLAWPRHCPNFELGDLVYSENIGATATPRRRTSTASRRPKWCM